MRTTDPVRHNHRQCINAALTAAERICRQKGLRLTSLRRRVLELIWRNHRPTSAYDLLGQLRREKANAAPPTVYRALDFLLAHNLAHKIQSLNAYVGCTQPHHRHGGQFLICTQCNQVAEIGDAAVHRLIEATASRAGLESAMQTVEISGRCRACR